MKKNYLLKLDAELKEELEKIASEMGISLNALLQIELRKIVKKKG